MAKVKEYEHKIDPVRCLPRWNVSRFRTGMINSIFLFFQGMPRFLRRGFLRGSISDGVNKLYGLTDEEIRIPERGNKCLNQNSP